MEVMKVPIATRKTSTKSSKNFVKIETKIEAPKEMLLPAALPFQSASQVWLDRRLAGLYCTDLCSESLRFYSISLLEPPPQFKPYWQFCTEKLCARFSDKEAAAVKDVQAIVIICNPFLPSEMVQLTKFINSVDMLGHDAPPMFWMPHTVAPEGRSEETCLNITKHSTVRDVLELGIDGIIDGEPEGFNLALAMQAQIQSAGARSRALTDMVNDRRDKAKYAQCLKECIHAMLWDYTRVRLTPTVPPVDHDLPAGEPRELGSFTVGKELGRGAFGCVHKLHPKDSRQMKGMGQVVKLVSKAGVRDISDLRSMKRTIDVMRWLSSAQFSHVNIVQLYAVHHSMTHVMFVMEDGGPENLYRRLCYRTHKHLQLRRPMLLPVVESLIVQATNAVYHIHMVAGVCHRDIKPENFIVLDQACDGLILKLADFDLAIMYQKDMKCRTPCGTLPFSAPEVLLEPEYDGQKCDVWSLGVVLLEVLCGCRILEQALALDEIAAEQNNKVDRAIAHRIREGFQRPNSVAKIMKQFFLAEVGPICTVMLTMLEGMLSVDAKERWNSAQVVAHFEARRHHHTKEPFA